MRYHKEEFIPKGSMCAVCEKKALDCSNLPFEDMNPIETKNGYTVVVCSYFVKKEKRS